jgi:hypothetical protein
MKVSYRVFKDFRISGLGETDEEILAAARKHDAKKFAKLRYSFVCMRYHPGRGKIYLGATNRAGDILVEYDVKKGSFRSCGFAKSGLLGPCDHKIHKGLWLNEREDAIYFGIATVSPFAESMDSRGGTLVRYDLKTRKFTCLARPTPGDYYQGTCFDFERRKAFMFTGRNMFAAYDLAKKKLVRYESMESVPHNACQDDRGGVWGTATPGRQELYRYDPDTDRFFFTGGTVTNGVAAANIMYSGAGPIDGMINGGDGFLYVGTGLGDFCRIDSKTGQVEYLGHPFPDHRLPGLALGPDGWIYLSGGHTKGRGCGIVRYNRAEKRFEQLGEVRAPDGEYLYYTHELVAIGRTIYLGETDNPSRSGFLWVCEL